MKKIIAGVIILLTVMLVVSCGKDNSNGDVDKKNEETAASGISDNLPPKDFNGREFVILAAKDGFEFAHFYDVNVETQNADLINDAIYDRNRRLENRFNIKITDKPYNDSETAVISKNALTGITDYHAYWVIVDQYSNLSHQNMFLDLKKVPDINLEQIYWDQNVVRDFTIGGKLYGIMGDISTSVSIYTHLFGVNKTVAANNNININELYQAVRDGKWTLDMMQGMIRDIYRDLNGDGKRDSADLYGLAVSPAIVEAIFSAAGEKWVTRDSAGDFALSSPTARMEAIYNKISEIITDKQATVTTWNIGNISGPIINNSYEYVYYDKFINNTLLFSDIDVGIIMDCRLTMDGDFGIVPVPKFDEIQKEYSVFAYPIYPLLSIPAVFGDSPEELDFIGTVIEGWAFASYEILTPAFYDKAFQTKYTRDEESIEMLDLILRSRIYDLMSIYDFGGMRSEFIEKVQLNKLNIMSMYEKYQAKAEKDIQKLFDAYAENN